jgi:hypothetical protein
MASRLTPRARTVAQIRMLIPFIFMAWPQVNDMASGPLPTAPIVERGARLSVILLQDYSLSQRDGRVLGTPESFVKRLGPVRVKIGRTRVDHISSELCSIADPRRSHSRLPTKCPKGHADRHSRGVRRAESVPG